MEKKIEYKGYTYNENTGEVTLNVSIPNELVTEENLEQLKRQVKDIFYKAEQKATDEISAKMVFDWLKGVDWRGKE